MDFWGNSKSILMPVTCIKEERVDKVINTRWELLLAPLKLW